MVGVRLIGAFAGAGAGVAEVITVGEELPLAHEGDLATFAEGVLSGERADGEMAAGTESMEGGAFPFARDGDVSDLDGEVLSGEGKEQEALQPSCGSNKNMRMPVLLPTARVE